MSTTRVDEIAIFLLTNLFTSKLNALGISNLPTAIQTVRAAWKDDSKKKTGKIVYLAGIFNSLVVVSGLTGRWPYLIQTNAVANILNGVKESIAARRKAESVSEEELNQESPRKRSILSNAIKNRLFPSRKASAKDTTSPAKMAADEVDSSNHSSEAADVPTSTKKVEETQATSSTSSSLKKRFFSSKNDPKDSTSKTVDKKADAANGSLSGSRRKKSLKKAQALLAGKRESAVDDILWGVFQISLVFFDLGRWQAIGHAWMVFLLHVIEETAFNEKLNRKQKMRKFAYLSVTAYYSGRLVYK